MRIEFHNRLGKPQSVEVTRVVVYDEHDNPVSLSLEVGNGVIYTADAGSPNFNEILRNLGIDRTVVVLTPNTIPLDQIQFTR